MTVRRQPVRLLLLLALLAAATGVLLLAGPARGALRQAVAVAGPRRTVAERLEQYGPAARARLTPRFAAVGVPYPPARLALVGLKAEKRLELWAAPAGRDAPLRHVHDYPILAASGGPGPKLREGDRQVPEGLYAIESLNPNSRFHLSLRVSYPNAFDRTMAARDGRTRLGGDIMIHGSSVSIGCLAMGDPAAEELFTLAADTGLGNTRVILAPCDLRTLAPPAAASAPHGLPPWYPQLCASVRQALRALAPRPAIPARAAP